MDFGNFIKRHSSYTIPAAILLFIFYLLPDKEKYSPIPEIKTIIIICVLGCIAILLSSLAYYAYTRLDFNWLSKHNGNNKNLTETEKLGRYIVVGCIFLGMSVLIGFSVVGIYNGQLL